MRMIPAVLTVLLIVAPLSTRVTALGQPEDPWKEWLKEVDPIMTKAERSVFQSLKTEEDRGRFIESFWKTRDPDRRTAQNEYKTEYYRRISYADKNLGGARSDRGRIYLILGEPTNKESFTGSERVVDAELWSYYGEGRPGLPPVFNLIFFRRGDSGDYRLFYPGMDTALDVISPAYAYSVDSAVVAYDEIRKSAIELADATLSVIPGEGVPGFPATATSSNQIFAQIYTLPEREISRDYLRGFRSIEGTVDVTYSFKEMPGSAMTALSRNKGFSFLNYAIAPEAIQLVRTAEDLNQAQLILNLKIEGPKGKTLYQQERSVEFRLDDREAQAFRKNRIMFSGFLPVIPGTSHIKIMLSNRTTQEFLVHEESLQFGDARAPLMVGYKVETDSSDRFAPFSTGKHKFSVDPRSVFAKADTLGGAVFTDSRPTIRLTAAEREKESVEIADIVAADGYFLFKRNLADFKPGYYDLTIEAGGRKVGNLAIVILAERVAKPEAYEWSDPPGSEAAYDFEIGTQYLNLGDAPAALERFDALPRAFWDPRTKNILARAYYLAKDHDKVVELLEGQDVTKDYTVLSLLGNSSLELKHFRKAAEYFERLRGYGDTARLNQVLGAIFLSLGDREKANVYFDRAKALENKPPAKGATDRKEPGGEDK